MILYIYIILRPWSTAQISQEQQDLGSWVVISFRVRDPKSDGCEVLPRMDFWGPSSKQFRGPQKKRSPTSRVLYFIYIYMYTYAYIYDPWVGSPIRWSYLRVNVSIPGRFTLGAIAPAKHGIQNRRLRLPVVPRVQTTWNNHIEWIKPDNLKTHERLWSSSLTFLIRFASLRRFCNSNWRAEWKILHAPYRMISILCGNQTCQTGTSPICISI